MSGSVCSETHGSGSDQTKKQPDNLSFNEICPAVDEDGRITDELCSEKFFFVCKSPCKYFYFKVCFWVLN